MIVYSACKPFYGRHPADFTYDVTDPATFALAWRGVGRAMQDELALIVKGLRSAPPALVRRYAPVWHKDILMAVRKKPKRLIALLAREAILINAVIGWGTVLTEAAGRRFSKAVAAAARNYNLSASELREKVLDAVSEALQTQLDAFDSSENVFNRGFLEDYDTFAARRPDRWVA